MIEALKMIIAASPAAGSEAIACLRAIKAKSPMVTSRYNRVVEMAFSDPDAEFSPEDRRLIASFVGGEDDDPTGGDGKSEVIRLRVTPVQLAEIRERAADHDISVSEYVRQRALA